jgi:hypothetical protein
MNHDQVAAILTLYQPVLEAAKAWVLANVKPDEIAGHHTSTRPWCLDDILVSQDGIEVKWTRYMGCSEYDYTSTFHRLEDAFPTEH